MPCFWDKDQRRDPQHARLEVSGAVYSSLRYAAIRRERAFGFRMLLLRHFPSEFPQAGIPGHRAWRDGVRACARRCRASASPHPSRHANPTATTALGGPDDPAFRRGFAFWHWTSTSRTKVIHGWRARAAVSKPGQRSVGANGALDATGLRSRWMARSGHADTHNPQARHASGWTTSA